MKHSNCLQCGQEFKATRSDKKYCSDSCKQQAYKSRQNGDSIGNVEDDTPKVNPAVFPFLKEYLKGLLPDKFSYDYPASHLIGLEQVKVSKSGMFEVQSTSEQDILKVHQDLLNGKGKILNGRTRVVNVEKELSWCVDDIPEKQTFITYKILIPYDIVREQLKEYSDDDLILE